MTTIYTIGYTGFNLAEFIRVLKERDINILIDVRSNPSSKYYTDFNKEELTKSLEVEGIRYDNFKEEFGARQNNLKFYIEGYLDFQLFCNSNRFKDGIKKLKNATKRNYNIALMCAEKDPINCHRCIMIGNGIRNYFDVQHILPDKSLQSQNDIDKKLLHKYFPNRNQLSLLDENISDNEYIEKAYKIRNKDIGYKIKGDEEADE